MASTDAGSGSPSLTNYVAYRDPRAPGQTRIGSLDLATSKIQPLAFASGTPISNLYQVIHAGETGIVPTGTVVALSSVDLLPPISGRDVLAVGKNYAEHAREFNSSGYDSSDRADQPTHPVIFTKRATSIIASGEPILAHGGFTESPDYEGEIGVIIGRSGFRISEEDAMGHVWGYTIINDVTARERQRDHKQFFIGKSADTYCPMGPIAVPAHRLPKVLQVETSVNGEARQKATTEDLIFSVPFLVKTLSEGSTLRPGDVLATGTPAGVGIGRKPPVFLKAGDVVEVSVTGLGTLRNEMAGPSARNQTVPRVLSESAAAHVPISNLDRTCGGQGLTALNGKRLYYRRAGLPAGPPVIFIHGLGGSSENYTPLIGALSLEETHSLHLLDQEGHGLSPTAATSAISIASYAADVAALAEHAGIASGAAVMAHGMGCLVAGTLALEHPRLVSRLVLLGPPPSPAPGAGRRGPVARAATVRAQGMAAVVDAVTAAATSAATRARNHLAVAAIRMSLLGQDPEGYAKGCTALGAAEKGLEWGRIEAKTLIVTGDEDKVSPPAVCEKMAAQIQGSVVKVLPETGHWHVFENLKDTTEAVKSFL